MMEIDESILDYSIPTLDETYFEPTTPHEGDGPVPNFRSVMDLQPTPTFTDRRLPHIYRYICFS
jgi:hypothetical protein